MSPHYHFEIQLFQMGIFFANNTKTADPLNMAPEQERIGPKIYNVQSSQTVQHMPAKSQSFLCQAQDEGNCAEGSHGSINNGFHSKAEESDRKGV